MNGKFRLPSPMEARFRERDLDAPLTVACQCGWSVSDMARVALHAMRVHLAEFHPERVDRGQKARQNAAKNAPVSYWSTRATKLGEM
jgi:hypothetical protein